MTTPNPIALAEEVLKLDETAQIGPWFEDEEHELHSADRYVMGLKTHEHVTGALEWPVVAANRKLITTYRTAAPILATEVQRLTAELAEEKRKVEVAGKALSASHAVLSLVPTVEPTPRYLAELHKSFVMPTLAKINEAIAALTTSERP